MRIGCGARGNSGARGEDTHRRTRGHTLRREREGRGRTRVRGRGRARVRENMSTFLRRNERMFPKISDFNDVKSNRCMQCTLYVRCMQRGDK